MSSISTQGMSRRQFVAAASAVALAGLVGTRALATQGEAATSEEVDASAAADAKAAQATAEPYVPSATEYPLTLTMWDGDGTEFEQTYEAAPTTAVTLTDSMAEIMCRLGLADRVLGTVTPEAAMPDDIADAYAGIEQLGDKKTLSRETVVGLGPEIVLGRAMTFTAEGQTDAATYNDLGIKLYVQTASAAKGNPTLQGVIDDVKNVAAIFDAQQAASDLVNDLSERLAAIESRVAEASEAAGEPQSVLIMTSLKDGAFGTFGGKTGASLQFNMIESMGAVMASTESASGLTFENLITLNPDVILYITADRNAETDAVALDTLFGEQAIQTVPAIADQRVVELPYAEFMDYTPRVFDSAEKILATLYPEA